MKKLFLFQGGGLAPQAESWRCPKSPGPQPCRPRNSTVSRCSLWRGSQEMSPRLNGRIYKHRGGCVRVGPGQFTSSAYNMWYGICTSTPPNFCQTFLMDNKGQAWSSGISSRCGGDLRKHSPITAPVSGTLMTLGRVANTCSLISLLSGSMNTRLMLTLPVFRIDYNNGSDHRFLNHRHDNGAMHSAVHPKQCDQVQVFPSILSHLFIKNVLACNEASPVPAHSRHSRMVNKAPPITES